MYKCWTCAKNFPRHAEDALKNALHMLSICMTPVANWKSLQSEKFLLFLLDTFGVVELAYRYIFFFKFILSCQQFDNCSHCLTPVSFTLAANLLPVSLTLVATSINNTSKCGGKICRRCRWYRWCTLTFEKVLMEYSWAGGKLIHENTSSKN